MKILIKTVLLLPLLLAWSLTSAQADILVVTSAKSSVSQLSDAQVKQLFTGVLHEVNGHKLTPIDLPEDSNVRNEFYKTVVGRTAQQMRAYWTRLIFTGRGAPPATASENDLPLRLQSDENLVGYLPGDADTSGLIVLNRVN